MATNPKPPTPANLSLDKINKHFGTDEAARVYLEAVRWPNGPVCAHCGNNGKGVWKIEANAKRKVRPGLYECGQCHKQFTVTVGTIFESSKIPLRKVAGRLVHGLLAPRRALRPSRFSVSLRSAPTEPRGSCCTASATPSAIQSSTRARS